MYHINVIDTHEQSFVELHSLCSGQRLSLTDLMIYPCSESNIL